LISPTCLCAAFTRSDLKRAKRQSSHQCLFMLLGYVLEDAARKILANSAPGSNPVKEILS